MTFNSLEFVAFLPVVVLGSWLLHGARRRLWLLVASYVFYGWWDWRFTLLLALSTIIDFNVGRAIAATDDVQRRRRLLQVSLTANLLLLGTFKYFNFFVDSIAGGLGRLGLETNEVALQLILPVGISFYTFQTISYTVGVHRRTVTPTPSLVTFGLYVAFFPQLVAGPIERAERLLPQLQNGPSRPPPTEVSQGLWLILLGLVKKVVIADSAARIADPVFAQPDSHGAVMLIAATIAFALQIYFDFSGYTDIARGAAKLMAIDLMPNFTQPYLSRNITEFWRRWHISLSTWLRDYLYIPLGGSRSSPAATRRNLAITMLLGGLWHGAGWNFVIWGGLHGLYLGAHKLWGSGEAATGELRARDTGRIGATLAAVLFAWIFFRAGSVTAAASIITGILTFAPGPLDPNLLLLPLLVSAALTMDLLQRNGWTAQRLQVAPPAVRGLCLGAAASAMVLFSGAPQVPFIYFQF